LGQVFRGIALSDESVSKKASAEGCENPTDHD